MRMISTIITSAFLLAYFLGKKVREEGSEVRWLQGKKEKQKEK
jgi:hypothetical protein